VIVGITCGGPDLSARIERALEAGLDRVIVRETTIPTGVRVLAGRWPRRVVLHARMPGARESGLPVHLSGDQLAEVLAGAAPPPGPWSASAHSGDEVRAALAAGAAWALLSPIWRSPSKPEDRRPPLGLDVLRGTQGAVALGGVSLERVHLCREAGAAGVAGMGGIFGAPDVATAVRAWRVAWDAVGTPEQRTRR
jgi:thiamine-phosphate pyrophosphorylase